MKKGLTFAENEIATGGGKAWKNFVLEDGWHKATPPFGGIRSCCTLPVLFFWQIEPKTA